MTILALLYLLAIPTTVLLLAINDSNAMKERHYMALNGTLFSAETITGCNERKGSEMPAERNDGQRYCLPVERHACAETNLNVCGVDKVHATPSNLHAERGNKIVRRHSNEQSTQEPVCSRPHVQNYLADAINLRPTPKPSQSQSEGQFNLTSRANRTAPCHSSPEIR